MPALGRRLLTAGPVPNTHRVSVGVSEHGRRTIGACRKAAPRTHCPDRTFVGESSLQGEPLARERW